MRKIILSLFLIVPLAACGTGRDEAVPGYAELKNSFCSESAETYDAAACERLRLQDMLGQYRQAQAVILAIMGNPDVPQSAKDGLREADAAASSALAIYTEAVVQSSDDTEALALAALDALQTIQARLIQIQQGG